MVNTEKVKMSPLYLTLIRQLHQDKVEIGRASCRERVFGFV